MGDIQGIGVVQGAGVEPGDRGGVREVIGPDTEPGQALAIAVAGFLVILLTVARTERGAIAKVGRAIEFVVLVAAAMWVANYATRMYVLTNEDGPLSDGFRVIG